MEQDNPIMRELVGMVTRRTTILIANHLRDAANRGEADDLSGKDALIIVADALLKGIETPFGLKK